MFKRPLLILCLLLVGVSFEHFVLDLLSRKPKPLITVGERLLVARSSKDGCYIAGLGPHTADTWRLQVWDDKGSLKLEHDRIPIPPGRSPALAWSDDGTQLALAAAGEVRVISLVGAPLQVLKAQSPVRQLEYEGSSLVARSNDQIAVWSQGWKKRPWVIKAPYLLQIALDDTGERLAVATFEGGLHVYHLPKRKLLHQLEGRHTVSNPLFSRNGDYLTYVIRNRNDRHQDRVVTHSFKTSDRLVTEPIVVSSIQGIRVDSIGSTVLITGAKHTAWELSTGRLKREVPVQSNLISSLSPNADIALIAPSDKPGAALWKLSDNDASPVPISEKQTVSDLSFIDNQRVLVVADGKATIWKL